MTDTLNPVDSEAIEWVVRLHSDQRTRADEAAFRAWLEQDAAHARAYADNAALWDGVATLSVDEDAQAILSRVRAPRRSWPKPFSRRVALAGGASAIAAAAAGLIVAPAILLGDRTYRSAPGQQRSIGLSDGSNILLNTDTVLRVSLSAHERRLFLDRGQAFFQVAKDKGRPFRVFVGADEVRALGTAFEVRRVGDAARVTLEEGKVAIFRGRAEGQPASSAPAQAKAATAVTVDEAALEPAVILRPGEQVELANATLAVTRVDLSHTQAWRYGRMILDDATLGDTVGDLNRYGGTQIVLADPKLAQIRVSGVFHTGQPDDFVESVTAAFPVVAVRRDENTIVLSAR